MKSGTISASSKLPAHQQPVLGAAAPFASTRNRGEPGTNITEFVRARRYIGTVVVGLVVLAFVAAFNADSASKDDRAKNTVVYGDLLNRYQSDDRDILRMRIDTARNRIWVLTLENVHVYDTAAHMLLRRIRLPQW